MSGKTAANPKNFLTGIKNLSGGLRHFLEEELWLKDVTGYSAAKRLLFSFCRVVMIVIRGFQHDNCSLQASALTYITLVSLVPVLAIMLSFSKGMGMQKKLLNTLGMQRIMVMDESEEKHHFEYKIINLEPEETSETAENNSSLPVKIKQAKFRPEEGIAHKLPPPMQDALIKIFTYVENTNFAAMGLIGSVMLLFSVICSMAKLEITLNTIWGVKESRTILKKCSEYLVVLILIPVVFLVATSLNTMLLSNKFMDYLAGNFGGIAAMLRCMMRLLGTLFILCGFGFFYIFMPNTRVKALPAMTGGIIAGLLWFAVQWAYMSLQMGLTRFNSIYGTFAVVPFFLAWLYANWSIILFGAEITFAVQNHKTIHLEKASESASTGICIVLGQLLLFEACKAFHSGNGPWSPLDFGQEKSIPTRIIKHVVNVLVNAKILARAASTGNRELYLPGRDIATLSPADVEEAFRQNQSLDTKLYFNSLPAQLRENYRRNYSAFYTNLESMKFDKLILPVKEQP